MQSYKADQMGIGLRTEFENFEINQKLKDEKIDTKDMKQLIKLVRKTFNPLRMASGLTKQNNTQVA